MPCLHEGGQDRLACSASIEEFEAWYAGAYAPAGVSGIFIDIKAFRSHNYRGVDSASNRNKYREYFLGVKAAGV